MMLRYFLLGIPVSFAGLNVSALLTALAQDVIGVEIPGWANFGLAGVIVWITIMWKRSDDIKYQKSLSELAEKRMEVDERHQGTMKELMEKQLDVNARTAQAMSDMSKAVDKLGGMSEVKEMIRDLRSTK